MGVGLGQHQPEIGLLNNAKHLPTPPTPTPTVRGEEGRDGGEQDMLPGSAPSVSPHGSLEMAKGGPSLLLTAPSWRHFEGEGSSRRREG